MSAETGQRLGFVVTQLGLLSERALADLYGEILEVEPVAVEEYPVLPLIPETVAQKFLRRVYALPLEQQGEDLIVAMVDPLDTATIHAISFSAGLNVIPRPALLSELDAALTRLFPEKAAPVDKSDILSEAYKRDINLPESFWQVKNHSSLHLFRSGS